MKVNDVFEDFNVGSLSLPKGKVEFSALQWHQHPTFAGVELKHLIMAQDTEGKFSYHLVKIAPNKKIGLHIHENQLETHEVIAGSGICFNDGVEIEYKPGVISIFPASVQHEIMADAEGLFLFAKFFPALC